jgi:hypothetical protein
MYLINIIMPLTLRKAKREKNEGERNSPLFLPSPPRNKKSCGFPKHHNLVHDSPDPASLVSQPLFSLFSFDDDLELFFSL